VIAGYKHATGVHTWRQERWGVSVTRRYFEFLAANGYGAPSRSSPRG
jgi:hypothetical protein